MSVCLLYVREFSLSWRKKTGDPTPALQNPSLDQSLSIQYIDYGISITYVQLNLFGERFSRTLQTFAQDNQKLTKSSLQASETYISHL
jgi:hypothetical protein